MLGVAGVLAAWMAVGGIMVSAYVSPQVREGDVCQMVCRQASAHHVEG